MQRSPSRPRVTRARAARARSSRFRGWLTLIVLVCAALVIAIGPGQIAEFASGLFFHRPAAATLVAPTTTQVAESLQTRLEDVRRGLSRGQLAAAAIDLQTGATASIDASRTYSSASLFKLPILLEVLAEQDAGRLDPARQVEIRPDDWTDGSGVLQARVGDSLSVQELTRLMIADSDNIAALALLDVVGVPATNAMSERLGLVRTHVVDHRAGEPGDHTTSADDLAHLLFQLTQGEAVNQRISEQALRLLELRQSVSWLTDDLLFWVKVAHKWGDLPDARHDAGIVYAPRGSYVIVVLTEDAPPDEAATAIARASRMVYDYLGNR